MICPIRGFLTKDNLIIKPFKNVGAVFIEMALMAKRTLLCLAFIQ